MRKYNHRSEEMISLPLPKVPIKGSFKRFECNQSSICHVRKHNHRNGEFIALPLPIVPIKGSFNRSEFEFEF